MNDATATSDGSMRRRLRSVLTPEVISIVTVGIALGALSLNTADRITAFQAEAAADRRAFQAEAATDRRAFQAAMDQFRNRMDEFRGDIQRLGERQAHLEGQREGSADQ